MQALKAAKFLYVWLFCRRAFYGWHQRLLRVAVHGMGYGNPTDRLISPGEDRLLKRLAFITDLRVFDVGAHAGEYAQRVRQFCPTAKIWCFEPHPATYKLLRDVSDAFGNTALNVGLSPAVGSAALFDFASSQTIAGSAQASMESGSSKHYMVGVRWLSRLM